MPKYENKVTLGNLIALLTFVILFIGSIASATSTVSRIDGAVSVVKAEQENMKANYQEKDRDLSAQLHDTKIELRSEIRDLRADIKADLSMIKRAVK